MFIFIINPTFNKNVLSLLDIYIDMKLIITENRMYNVFVKYMDSQYDLSYNIRTREFIDKDNDVFGYVGGGVFYYGGLSTELNLEGFFGNKTNKMLKTYLRDRFPDTHIYSIE